MTLLLIDAGNTRIKWARCVDGRLGALPRRGARPLGGGDFARRLFGARPPRGCWSRASPARACAARSRRRRGARVCRSSSCACPGAAGASRSGYLEPWRLGVDRFAGLVGAHALFAGVPLLVTGVGTALTLDLLAARAGTSAARSFPRPHSWSRRC